MNFNLGPYHSKISIAIIFILLIAIFLYSQSNTNCKRSIDPVANFVSDIDFAKQQLHFETIKSLRAESVRLAGRTNKISDLQMFVVPQVNCATMVRVGGIGDGGKWICNPWRVPKDCVVYSLGVSGDTSFETSMHEASGRRCKFYCVDPGDQDKNLFEAFDGVFLKASIAGQSDKDQKRISLIDMMAKFNHSKIDILKMDIESGEFESLTKFLNGGNFSDKETEMCQLMVEFHYTWGKLGRWRQLFELLEIKGFRMYSKEANAYCPQCYEYSYIHLSCFQQYGLAEGSTFFTYFI